MEALHTIVAIVIYMYSIFISFQMVQEFHESTTFLADTVVCKNKGFVCWAAGEKCVFWESEDISYSVYGGYFFFWWWGLWHDMVRDNLLLTFWFRIIDCFFQNLMHFSKRIDFLHNFQCLILPPRLLLGR